MLSPIDMKTVLCTDVSVLRTGLLSVKGCLEPLIRKDEQRVEVLRDTIEQALKKVQETLVEEEVIKSSEEINK